MQSRIQPRRFNDKGPAGAAAVFPEKALTQAKKREHNGAEVKSRMRYPAVVPAFHQRPPGIYPSSKCSRTLSRTSLRLNGLLITSWMPLQRSISGSRSPCQPVVMKNFVRPAEFS